jgi:hypothetical protein
MIFCFGKRRQHLLSAGPAAASTFCLYSRKIIGHFFPEIIKVSLAYVGFYIMQSHHLPQTVFVVG